jgi:Gene product 88
MTLKRTQDRKTANLSNAAGKVSVIANAFSLPAGKSYSCNGATSICEAICYAGKLERIYKGFRAVVLHNWELLNGASRAKMTLLLTDMVNDFRAECDKRGADKIFRIHADGDFFSEAYAIAWKAVIVNAPDVHFWVYTRSFTPSLNVIPTLAGIDNLTVYLSVDADNEKYVADVIADYPDVKLAGLATTFGEARDMLSTFTDKPMPNCPELTKAIPLIDEKGGACKTCGLCVNGRNNVLFAIKPKAR